MTSDPTTLLLLPSSQCAGRPNPKINICFCVVLQVRPASQRRRLADPELRARSLPHPVPYRVAAVERLPRHGHAGDEEGEQQRALPPGGLAWL